MGPEEKARLLDSPEEIGLLGLTHAALSELINGLPEDALAQAIAIAKPTQGDDRFLSVNGYVNQVLLREKDLGMSVCERRLRDGKAGVGRANIFVSWWLGQELSDVLDCVDVFLEESGRDRATTYFWVCDYSFDLKAIAKGDPTAELPARVRAIGHTLLLLDEWEDPGPTKRIWCVRSPAHTVLATFFASRTAHRAPRHTMTAIVAPSHTQVHLGGVHDAERRRGL